MAPDTTRIERFARDGIVFPLRALDEDETARLADRFRAFSQDDGGRTYARFAKKPHLERISGQFGV